jgi:hypothetical protein
MKNHQLAINRNMSCRDQYICITITNQFLFLNAKEERKRRMSIFLVLIRKFQSKMIYAFIGFWVVFFVGECKKRKRLLNYKYNYNPIR